VGVLALVLAAAAVAVLGLFVGQSIFGTKGSKVEVPPLEGVLQKEAENTLKARGLEPVISFQNSPTVSEGRVISQDPAARTTVSSGSRVIVVISQGEVRSVVPELVGLSLNAAKKALKDARLEAGKITMQNSERPEGEVLASSPKAGSRRAPESRVNLTVSNGVPLIEVPPVVGLTYATAYATLVQAGFTVPQDTPQEVSDAVPPGSVLKQVPAAGTKLPRGSIVSIVVAAAPEEEPEPEPEPEPTPVTTTTPEPEDPGPLFPPPAQQNAEVPATLPTSLGNLFRR
jgi:serine/threonine-protein kinase